MPEKWTGKIVGDLHVYRISQKELANKLGWSKEYVCTILSGKANPPGAKRKMKAALAELIAERSA